MKNYDEYQKFMRYKYSSHSFSIFTTLWIVNYFFSFILDIQWAESQHLETLLLIFIAVAYFLFMNTYRGSYFTKSQSPIFYSVLFFVLSILNIRLSFSPYTSLIINGQVTSNVINLAAGAIWLTIPIAYIARIIVEKKRNSNDD